MYTGTSLLRSPTGLGKSDLNGEVTLLIDCIDYLGVKLDVHLTWNDQIDAVCKKLVFIISPLSRLRHVLADFDVYFSPFSPFLTISLCRAGQYLSHPVFSVLRHVFSQSVFLHVSL